jgi:hypothetical protein
MGQLKPGATYVYERSNGITYAREVGSNERTPIGWDYISKYNAEEWYQIFKEADTNPALRKAIERVIMLYKLSVPKL